MLRRGTNFLLRLTSDNVRLSPVLLGLLHDILRQRRFLPSARMKAASACSVAGLHSAQQKLLLSMTKTKA